ncbi:MAG: hypothetical protein ACR2OO_06410 [Thermomicrobiales bacterium]
MTIANAEDEPIADRLARRLSRRSLAAATGLLLSGAVLGRADVLRTAAKTSSDVRRVIDAAITLEAFAVTFAGAARARQDAMKLSPETQRFLQAAQCVDEAHYHYFEAAGAIPAATAFTINSKLLKDQKTFLPAYQKTKSILLGSYMAAARQLAATGDFALVEIPYQVGTVEAQHQALTRVLSASRVPANRAFAAWQFRGIGDGLKALTDAGYIAGNGGSVAFPSPVDRNCRGVAGLVPETTDDQPPIAATGNATPVVSSPEASPKAASGAAI